MSAPEVGSADVLSHARLDFWGTGCDTCGYGAEHVRCDSCNWSEDNPSGSLWDLAVTFTAHWAEAHA